MPARFLTEEWVEAVRALVREAMAGSGDVRVQCAVTGGPDGDVRLHIVGAEVGMGPAADAAVTLTLPYVDAVAVIQGELEPSVAFMQGRMKTAGDLGQVLDLLAATATPAFRAARERITRETEF